MVACRSEQNPCCPCSIIVITMTIIIAIITLIMLLFVGVNSAQNRSTSKSLSALAVQSLSFPRPPRVLASFPRRIRPPPPGGPCLPPPRKVRGCVWVSCAGAGLHHSAASRLSLVPPNVAMTPRLFIPYSVFAKNSSRALETVCFSQP